MKKSSRKSGRRGRLSLPGSVALLAAFVVGCALDRGAGVQSQPGPSPQKGAAQKAGGVLLGQAAQGDWTTDAPGVRRRITAADLPKPYETKSVDNGPRLVPRPEGAWPKVPDGFKVEEFAAGLQGPRLLRVAPNGDIFVAESYAGRVRVLRAKDG